MLSALGGMFQAFSNVVGAGLNFASQLKTNASNERNVEATNATNYKIAQETNALSERMQREQWARDDNAYQRSVADMQAAGLNPLSGVSPQSSPMTASFNAPEMKAFQATAPNFDFAGIGSAIASAMQFDAQNSLANKELNLEAIKNGVDPNLLDESSSDQSALNFFKSILQSQASEANKNSSSYANRYSGPVGKTFGDLVDIIKAADAYTKNLKTNNPKPPVPKPSNAPVVIKGNGSVKLNPNSKYVEDYYYRKAKKARSDVFTKARNYISTRFAGGR